ncbi:MAG: hypothetical protein HZB26_20715 [Candidatus Hydrogenedentes bacterium]|nr:hypothetical protein [Candidatus Hydrogenedentota bacterium]
MKAGFARRCITPPLGTTMMGFATRDREHGCAGIHDDLYVRALFVEHGGAAALIMGFDLCFLGRADTDRLKDAIGHRLHLTPKQILLNASHTHVGPSVGTWAYAGYEPPDTRYLNDLEAATVTAAVEAAGRAADATLHCGAVHTTVPMNRRGRGADGAIANCPNPGGPIYDSIPVCEFRNKHDKPITFLFSVSCHPSIISGFDISAEYPGAAMEYLDAHFGGPVSMFLQGAGGDSKPAHIGGNIPRWRVGTWDDVKAVGEIAAREALSALEEGLTEVTPHIVTAMVETYWSLNPPMDRAGYAAEMDTDYELRRLWAERMIQRLDRDGALPTHAPITVQGIQLGEGLRFIGVEGELVAELGRLVRDFFHAGVTFPLGYTNGEGLYLPTSKMLDEGGYEAVSFWEYGFPSPLAKGIEDHLTHALDHLRTAGIR